MKMAEIKTIYKGESVTLLFTFPEAYDMARLASHKIFVGETEFTGVIEGQTIKLQLKSSDTDHMIGTHRIVCFIDDTTLGLRKPYCGELVIAKTQASGSTASVSNISDIIIPIVISETSITVGDILYNYVKGDKGDPFTYSDFTPEQIAELQQPATNAISSIEAVELAVEQAEGLRVTAEQDRQTNTATAIQNAENATDDANNAASLANEKAGLADQKATLANDAATLANTKAGLADTAATNANNVANTFAADLAAKELKANKKTTLTDNDTDYPTTKAVNSGLNAIKDKVISDNTLNATFLTGIWTADSATDLLTSTVAHGLAVGNTVSFDVGTGILPTGIVAEPEYYFIESVPTVYTLKLKSLWNGTVLNITADGTIGWKIRKATVVNSIDLNFADYSEIDIISTNATFCQFSNGNFYPRVGVQPTTCRIFVNETTTIGDSSNAILSSLIANKKYIKTPYRIKLIKLNASLYWIEIFINGLYSDNSNFSSPVAYTRTFTGTITGADLIQISILNGYTSEAKNGISNKIIKRW